MKSRNAAAAASSKRIHPNRTSKMKDEESYEQRVRIGGGRGFERCAETQEEREVPGRSQLTYCSREAKAKGCGNCRGVHPRRQAPPPPARPLVATLRPSLRPGAFRPPDHCPRLGCPIRRPRLRGPCNPASIHAPGLPAQAAPVFKHISKPFRPPLAAGDPAGNPGFSPR